MEPTHSIFHFHICFNMGLPCVSFRVLVPILLKITASHLNLLFAHLKHFLILLVFSQCNHHDHGHDHNHHHHQNRPSPSLVAVPVFFLAESIKKQLPVMSYCNFVEKRSTRSSSSEIGKSITDGVICIVCMNGIEGSQEIRVPFNCCHVFHRDCLDAWVDQGQATCPLCRSKLLPCRSSQNHDDQDEFGSERDPWRTERMVYLFGDDCFVGDQN